MNTSLILCKWIYPHAYSIIHKSQNHPPPLPPRCLHPWLVGGASVPPMQFLWGHHCMRASLTGSWTKFLNHYSIPVSTWELATIKMYIIKSLLCSYHDYKNWTLLIRIGIDTQNYTKACVMCEVGEGAKFYHLLKYFVKICRSARDLWVRWGSQGWDFCSSYVVPWNTPLRRGLRDWKDDGCDE